MHRHRAHLHAALIAVAVAAALGAPATAAPPPAGWTAGADAACPHAWDNVFRRSHRLFMPQPLKGSWVWSRHQAWMESGCRPGVCSAAGACGVLQLLASTWDDVRADRAAAALAAEIGAPRGVFAARRNIVYGVRYMAGCVRLWLGRPRTIEELWDLALACYNAGRRNILRAQSRCGDGLTFDAIAPCLAEITGRHAVETLTYVLRARSLGRREAGAIPAILRAPRPPAPRPAGR